jgi:hypothetical protein
VAPQRKPKLPSVVTEHAIKNVCEKWTAEFARRFAHENEIAIDEYFRAVLGERPGFESEREMRQHANSLPGLWAAFWRPMRDGRVGAEVARAAKAFAPPLLAAALARVAAARGTLVELLSLDVETGVSTLRDLFDGTLYRVALLPRFVAQATRWMRFFGVLVERGDGFWTHPSILTGGPAYAEIEPAAFLAACAEAFATFGLDAGPLDPRAPQTALARGAGLAYGALVNLADAAARARPVKRRFVVNADGDRIEYQTATLRSLASPRARALVEALAGDDAFVRGDEGWFDWVGKPSQHGPFDAETLANVEVERNGQGVTVSANSPARLERALARLSAMAGAKLEVERLERTLPWQSNPAFAAEEGPDTERVVLAASAPIAAEGRPPPEAGLGMLLATMRRALDQDIPALGGAPRALVATEAGRAKVEGWLREAEQRGLPGAKAGALPYLDLDVLRRELGLPTVDETYVERAANEAPQ